MTARVPVAVAVALVLLSGLGFAACTATPPRDLKIAWDPVNRLNVNLPEGIRVFSGGDPSLPLRAWYVRVAEGREDIETRVAVAHDEDLRETASDFARRTGARVVVNAGYFRIDLDPAVHVGLLLVDGTLVAPATRSVLRDGRRYYLARAALGLLPQGIPDVAWVSSRAGTLYEWPSPPPNAPDDPVEELDLEGLQVWPAYQAVAGGPALVQGGELHVTVNEEVFFGSAIPDVHPRTAAGVTSEGDLILLVVDGRQRDSRGVDLVELATLMRDLGCVEAINLDGGGSSTLVVDNELLNHPVGGSTEREIMSALTVMYRQVETDRTLR